MDKLNTYTSTGSKLIHHPSVIKLVQQGFARPISLQIAPTSECNLKCSFCSNVNRKKHEMLQPTHLTKNILKLLEYKTVKTLEWTGGGDPTMYPHLSDLILYFSEFNEIQQGLITNGILLKNNVEQEAIDKLHWVRISMNCLDYVEKIELPKIKGTLGFSYVMNDKTNRDVLFRLAAHVKHYKPKYVRIVTNCQATDLEQKENNEKFSKMAAEWGEPYFYQPKEFNTPKNCYWCYFKPFILHDGWVYPCSSVILNDSADKQFHSDFRWVKLDNLDDVYKRKIKSFNVSKCNHCVFSQQNAMVDSILNPDGMVNFI